MPDTPQTTPTAAILIIGNEVLSGRTKDANLPFLGERLSGLGIRLIEGRVIPDIAATIIATVNELRARVDYLFTTGGIGPTHDDITSACVAQAFGTVLERNPEAVRRLEAHYPPGELTEARLKMADIPIGATLIDNPVSRAPGFRLGNVFVMAGVPRIMQAMFDGIVPHMRQGPPVRAITLTCPLAEGTIATALGAIQADFPTIEIGSYPYFRRGDDFGVALVCRGSDLAALDGAAAAIRAMITGHGVSFTEDRSGG